MAMKCELIPNEAPGLFFLLKTNFHKQRCCKVVMEHLQLKHWEILRRIEPITRKESIKVHTCFCQSNEGSLSCSQLSEPFTAQLITFPCTQ